MNAQVGFQGSLITSSNYFVLSWAAASAPGVTIGYYAPTKPYSFPIEYTITGLTSQLYIVTLWENSTAVPGGTSRGTYSFQPSSSSTTGRTDLYLTADISTGFTSGATTYVDSSLIGWNIDVELFGSGTLEAGTDYNFDNTTGTITFTMTGFTITPSMRVIIHFQPQISTAIATPPSIISSGVTITANTTLDNTYVNKAIFLQGAGSDLVCSLPALSSISDWQMLIFYSNGGSHLNAVLNCSGTDKILWKSNVSQLILAQYEQLKLFKANGVWNVDYASPGINAVGEVVDLFTYGGPNALRLNGQLLNRTDYPRLWNWVQSLPSGCLISDATWTATSTLNGQTYFINKGFFTTGDGSSTFRLPDFTYAGYRRNGLGAGGDVAGTFKNGTVGQFTSGVQIPVGNSFTGPAGGSWGGYAGRGQNNEATQSYSNTFNSGVQNTPNSVGIVAAIRF